MHQQFYIIRHGETEYNKLGIVQGSGVDSSLNDTGMEQARAFFEYYKQVPFDKIYISGLQRTRQSVSAFIEKGIPYEVIEELNEISWGDLEGVHITPELKVPFNKILNAWQQGNLDIAYENAESPLQLQKRQRIALEKILANKTDRKILIATHGRYLRAFLCLLLNHPLHAMDDFNHSNLCLYVLNYDGVNFSLQEECSITHLSE